MADEPLSKTDLGAAHLRPRLRQSPTPSRQAEETPVGLAAWEGPRERGIGAAFATTWWRVVTAPAAFWQALPGRGGLRRPAAFALLCAVVFGVVSELIDSATLALIQYRGGGTGLAEIFQLDIAGRSLGWLPISVLSVGGCLLAILVAGPVFLLVYCLVVAAWASLVHGLLKVGGGLASSESGYQGTVRAVCYSQAAMAAAIVPAIGDPLAVLWSLCLQVPGLARIHGCSRGKAALAVAVPAALLALALVALVLVERG